MLWLWLLVPVGLVVAGVVFLVVAVRVHRTTVRRELRALIEERYPQYEVIEERDDALRVRVRAADDEEPGNATMFLANLYRKVASSNARTAEDRRAIYELHLKSLEESRELGELGEKDHSRILPRLITDAMLEGVPPQAVIPREPLGETGLLVTYVIDSPNSVAYLVEAQLERLGLTREELRPLAMENLRRIGPIPELGPTLNEGQMQVVKALDTYDAARLLLLPELLEEGQEVAACVPDRDTLVILPVPDDETIARLLEAGQTTTAPPLIPDPIRVTRDGFAKMGP